MISGDPLGDILLLAAPLGIAGVFAMALFERVVPVLPSQGLFAAIGIAAAEGLWCLPTAIAASIVGSALGALAAYRLGVGLASGERSMARVRGLLRRRDRIGMLLRRARRNSATLPFFAQLLPGARLVAPIVGGAMRDDPRVLAKKTLAGLAIWNATFIAIGYAMMRLTGSTNATSVSMSVLVLLCSLFLVIRLTRTARSGLAMQALIANTLRPLSRQWR